MPYCAKDFFERLIDSGELKEYLFDAFERHSHAHQVHMDEFSHMMEIKSSIEADLAEHSSNKAVSHEMWAVVTLVSQFERTQKLNTRVPVFLGPKVYDDPSFLETLGIVRQHMRARPVLMRA